MISRVNPIESSSFFILNEQTYSGNPKFTSSFLQRIMVFHNTLRIPCHSRLAISLASRTSTKPCQFSTSALVQAVRPGSTFFNSNVGRTNSHFRTNSQQQQGHGLQRWEGTLRTGEGASGRRSFSMSYSSLGTQALFGHPRKQLLQRN